MMGRRSFRMVLYACAAFLILDAAWLHAQLGGPTATQWYSDLVGIGYALFATAATWIAARRAVGRARRAWFLLGLATASWGAGEAVWSWYELALGREVPFPSPADIGFLGLIPFAVWGLLSFPVAPQRAGSKTRSVIDGLVTAGSVLFVSWATVLGPTFRDRSGSAFTQAIGIAYPAGDLMLIVVVLIVAARARGARGPFAWIGAGLAALALADSGFLYLTQTGDYATGSMIDSAWNLGFVLIALGALSGRARSAEAEPERLGRWQVLLPYVPFLLAMVVAGGEQIRSGALGPFLFWTAIATVTLISVRTILMHLDNVALNHDLEAKVQGRTAELSAALREVEAARSLQDAFLGSVSHELRTPLTTLLGATSTMLRPDLGASPVLRKLAEATRRGAERMNRLVEDLLISSSITDGIEHERVPFDLSEVVLRAAGDPIFDGRVDTGSIPPVSEALGDAGRAAVVLHHLLDNARKFAPSGPISVAVRTGDHIEVEVCDEGPGIPRALRERVFDRFFQIDGRTTRVAQGAGLGLYIARRLAEGMGGTLRVADSARGARFVFTLPAAVASEAAARLTA